MKELDPDFPDEQIGEICRVLDIPFVASKKHLGVHDYRERDTHWNERGHHKMADLLSHLHQVYGFTNSALPQTSNNPAATVPTG
jgi:hypothetical protein